MAMVICRARLGHNCDHAKDERAVYPPDSPMASDGTWDGRTVICTPCYVRLLPFTPDGMGLLEDLELAIQLYRDAHRKMEDRVESFIGANAKEEGVKVVPEKLADGSMRMLVMKDGGVVAEAILPPGKPIRWK